MHRSTDNNFSGKQEYVSPSLEVTELKFEGLICQSPGGGGSEGTGDEPLFAPLFNNLDDSINI